MRIGVSITKPTTVPSAVRTLRRREPGCEEPGEALAADQTVVTAPTEPTETSNTAEFQARREMAAADQAIKR